MKTAKPTQTIWFKYRCGGGARWTTIFPPGHMLEEFDVCTFSGCHCGTKAELVGTTTDRNEASDWFRRPAR